MLILPQLKVAPCDNINFGNWFCNEVVYPADHDFNCISTFLRIRRKPKQTICTPNSPGALDRILHKPPKIDKTYFSAITPNVLRNMLTKVPKFPWCAFLNILFFFIFFYFLEVQGHLKVLKVIKRYYDKKCHIGANHVLLYVL